MAPLAAIFDVVVDRMIVAGDGLERGEMRVGDGAARNIEPPADLKVLEEPALRKPMRPPVENLAHAARRCAPSMIM
jgi:hypothetical protein